MASLATTASCGVCDRDLAGTGYAHPDGSSLRRVCDDCLEAVVQYRASEDKDLNALRVFLHGARLLPGCPPPPPPPADLKAKRKKLYRFMVQHAANLGLKVFKVDKLVHTPGDWEK